MKNIGVFILVLWSATMIQCNTVEDAKKSIPNIDPVEDSDNQYTLVRDGRSSFGSFRKRCQSLGYGSGYYGLARDIDCIRKCFQQLEACRKVMDWDDCLHPSQCASLC